MNVYQTYCAFIFSLKREKKNKCANVLLTSNFLKKFDVKSTKAVKLPVLIAMRQHLFPFRTQKLSSSTPMVLCGQPYGRVGRCRLLYCLFY